MTDCAGCDDCAFDVENAGKQGLIHEVHITVRTDDVDGFKEFCKANDIKMVLIQYESIDGVQVMDPMTSQRVDGFHTAVLAEAHRITNLFVDNGFQPIRTKIETVPHSYLVDRTDGYFESHIGVYVPVAFEDRFRDLISTYHCVSSGNGVHVSRNAYHQDGDQKKIMVTYRYYGESPHVVYCDVDGMKSFIEGSGYQTDKTIIEYCWFDSNLAHDNEWMGS